MHEIVSFTVSASYLIMRRSIQDSVFPLACMIDVLWKSAEMKISVKRFLDLGRGGAYQEHSIMEDPTASSNF